MLDGNTYLFQSLLHVKILFAEIEEVITTNQKKEIIDETKNQGKTPRTGTTLEKGTNAHTTEIVIMVASGTEIPASTLITIVKRNRKTPQTEFSRTCASRQSLSYKRAVRVTNSGRRRSKTVKRGTLKSLSPPPTTFPLTLTLILSHHENWLVFQ